MLLAQTHFYYRNGKKQELLLDQQHINVFVTSQFNKEALISLGLTALKWQKNELKTDEQWAELEFITAPTAIAYLQKLNALQNLAGVTGTGKHFINKNKHKTHVGSSNLFYVQLKSLDQLPALQALATQKKVTLLRQVAYMPLWVALYRNSDAPEDALTLCNQFYETRMFQHVDPNFITEILLPEPPPPAINCLYNNTSATCTNDALFNKQWGLKNVTNPNADINMCEAWTLSTGANTKIAIIDSGIQLNHPDLQTNISPFSFDTETNTSPSQVYQYHGTFVAGIAGASRNNAQGVAGVAPNTQLISVSNVGSGQESLTVCEKMATGISWAVNYSEADIINNSWGIPYPDTFSSALLESAIINATTNGRGGKGAIVVFASGNEGVDGEDLIRYPANNPNLDILSVGAIDSNGNRAFFSSFGATLGVVAPGVCIPSATTMSSVTYDVDHGTSFAAPHVSGVAALMLSVNPCLSRQQVYEIIEQTAQKVNSTVYQYATLPTKTNGTWNQEMGYGLLDAYAATQKALQMNASHLDLYIKDNTADFGIEPNTTSSVLWNSPNIWVRNNQDGVTLHQTPKYNQATPNYVYVKIENKSCFTSTGNEQLKVYYSRPSTTTPTSTSAAFRSSFAPVTGTEWVLIGTVNLPALQAGATTIINFPWTLPDPIGMYGCTSTSFNTALLAKIVATNDVNAVAETNNILTNIQNNNNIAGKSLITIDVNYLTNPEGNNTESSLLVANPFNQTRSFSIEMIKENLETGKAIYEEAEVSFKMDETLFNAWERGGKIAENISATDLETKKLVENNNVLVSNISLTANEQGTLKLFFNFLTDELTDKSKYLYHIIQKDALTSEIVSAVSFEINKEPRPVFEAIAADIEKDKTEVITITAEDINEPAIYNWYDSAGNLVFSGKDLTISNAVAQKYKLEVIATADGFKDYTEVEVSLKLSVLSSIAPNPATSAVTIGYKINDGGSAYLMVLGGYGTTATSNNYILAVNQSETTLDVSNYSNGFYTVALVVNGQIVDAKTLIKE